MEGIDIMTTVETVITYVTVAVGSASIIVQGIKLITDVTPSKKDDEFIEGAQKWLVKIVSILDKLALNPSKKDARPK